MRKKDLIKENDELRDTVMNQGRIITKTVFELLAAQVERDAAVNDIRMLGRMGKDICCVCAHYNHGAGNPEKCPKALKEDCFEWRGMKEG